jgi:hypothetical protein
MECLCKSVKIYPKRLADLKALSRLSKPSNVCKALRSFCRGPARNFNSEIKDKITLVFS